MHAPAYPTTAKRPALSDGQLIRSALNGDQDAYGQLAERYQDRLLTSIRQDVGCAVLAEDIVQDAFVRAFLHLDSFRNQSSFYTWLYRIALNSRRYYLRNRHRTLSLESLSESPSQDWVATQDSPADRIERIEECNRVRDALARLDERHRTILLLREFEGCDYRTIADVLHLTMGTVRSRLNRARAQLKRELTVYMASRPSKKIRPLRHEDWYDHPAALRA